MIKLRLIFILLFCTSLLGFSITSCSLKDAVKIQADASLLEAQAEKIDQSIVRLENVADRVEQSVLKVEISKSQEGDNFYYGAGWVVIGTSVMAIIFIGAIGLTIKYYLKAKSDAEILGLVTVAIKNVKPEISRKIKEQIEHEVSNGGPYKEIHKKQLAKFVKNNGTFVEK